MTPSDRATKLTVDLLRAVEAYDSKALGVTIKRIIPSHTRRVIAALAVLALMSLKQQHAGDWPEQVTATLDTYAQEAP